MATFLLVTSTGDQTHYDYLESETSEHWEKWLYAKETFTSDSDWSIRDLLDRADDHIVTEPEEALTQFRDILRSSPDSPRAQYAMLRARQFLNKTDFDDVTKAKDEEEIADGYLSLMRRPEEEVMGPIYFSALSQLLQLTSASNMTARKIEALEEALSGRASEGQNTHESLVQIYFLEGLLERAEVAVDVALGKFPTKFLFKFMKGLLLKKNDEKRKEGNRMLRAMDLEETNMHGIVSQVSELAAQLKARGRTEDMNLIYKEASKLHLYISVSQRPIEALPDLEAKPVWNTKDDVGLTAFDEEFTMLQDNWEIIKAEAIELRNNASNWQKVNQDDGAYEEFPLFTWGHRRAFHCSLAPKTCALVKRFRAAAKCNKGTTKFNVLRGGTRTASHAGPTNVRLRVQLGLQVNQFMFTTNYNKGSKKDVEIAK